MGSVLEPGSYRFPSFGGNRLSGLFLSLIKRIMGIRSLFEGGVPHEGVAGVLPTVFNPVKQGVNPGLSHGLTRCAFRV